MKANCKKCKHCVLIRGVFVACKVFSSCNVINEITLTPMPTYCVYFEKRSKKYNGWSLQ